VTNVISGTISFVLANPAGLPVLTIVSQNMGIVTRVNDPKFLCYNQLC